MSSRERTVGEAFGVSNVVFTTHARLRLSQRSLSTEEIEYVLEHGCRLRRTGIEFCVLRSRDISLIDRRSAVRLEGTVVLVSDDGVAITVYRSRRALAEIRRKAKHRRPIAWRGALAARRVSRPSTPPARQRGGAGSAISPASPPKDNVRPTASSHAPGSSEAPGD